MQFWKDKIGISVHMEVYWGAECNSSLQDPLVLFFLKKY